MYYQFSQKHFEFKLRQLCIENKLGFMSDITEEIQQDVACYEKVYKVTTKNKSVDLIIFSSVSINSNKVRNKGNDAVRIVMRWKTKKGYFYKRIGKNYRIDSLFENIKKNIIKANKEIFNLNFKDFSSSLDII